MVLRVGRYSSINQNLGIYSGLRRREINLEMGKQITIENASPISGECFFSVCKLFCFIFNLTKMNMYVKENDKIIEKITNNLIENIFSHFNKEIKTNEDTITYKQIIEYFYYL